MRGATRNALRRLCSRPRAPPPLVYLVAGEPSGDAIGAGLVRALRREYGAPLEFAGVGGDAMAAAGVRSLFPMEELSVMGFAEVVTSLPRLAVRLRQTLGEIRQRRPRLVVGIDSKGFCLRLLRALAGERRAAPADAPPVSLVQYAAPSVWAFRDADRRAAQLAGTVDELLLLLPFEERHWRDAGVRTTVVGHPAFEPEAAESAAPPIPAAADFRRAHGIADGGALLCLLPGSRQHEVAATLPPMLGAVALLRAEGGDAPPPRVVIPVAPKTRAAVESALRWSGEEATLVDSSERAGVYASAELAIACCGTVNVELALAGTPQLAVYRASALTAFVVRWLLRPVIRYATLPNVLAQLEGWERPELIPELLFERCAARPIADAARDLLTRPALRDAQAAAMKRALPRLAVADASGAVVPPSTVAARALIRYLP